MVDAEHRLDAGFAELGDLRGREGEVQEMHRGRLALGGGAVDIGLGHRSDGLAREAHGHGFLDAAQAGQERGPPDRVVDLEHQRGDQLVALGDQRVVGVELVGDLRLAALFDVEHLVDLVPHGVIGLEVEGGIGADACAAVALRLGDPAAAVGALAGVGLGRHDVGVLDLALGDHVQGSFHASQSVGARHQFDRMVMAIDGGGVHALSFRALHDVVAGQRTFGDDEARLLFGYLAGDRAADL